MAEESVISLEVMSQAVPIDFALYPERSLGRHGFRIMMSVALLVSVTIGIGFALIGAWPVTGFLGLDLLLLYGAFRWNYRDAKRAEFIRLEKDRLVVTKLTPDGHRSVCDFDPYWIQVRLERAEDHDNRLMLSSHGKEIVVGAFLNAAERRDVAKALRSALEAHRSAV